MAAAAVSFTLCPSDTQIPARPSPREPGSLNLGSWPEARSHRLPDGESTARFGQLPTAESPKCRWRLARAGAELRGTPPLGAEGVNGPVGGGRLVRRASISPAEGASPPLRLLRGPACPGGAGGRRADKLAGSLRGSRGFCQPAADVGAPLPSSPLTTAGGRLCAAPPSPAPAPRVPTPCLLYRKRRGGARGSLGPESSWEGAREPGSGRAPRGCGCREREREQVRASRSRASARQQLGPPFGKIIGT